MVTFSEFLWDSPIFVFTDAGSKDCTEDLVDDLISIGASTLALNLNTANSFRNKWQINIISNAYISWKQHENYSVGTEKN